MANTMEIDAIKVRDSVQSDPDTLLVCAYEGDDEFHQHDLEGAISLNDFRSLEPLLPKNRRIIFYCACPHNEAARGQAKKYSQEGFTNVKVLKGGANAWIDAGFPIVQKV